MENEGGRLRQPSLGALIMQRLDPNLPLWIAGLLIYFCGYFGFDLLFPIVIISIAHYYELLYVDKAVKLKLSDFFEAETQRMDETETNETCKWLNGIIKHMWPHLNQSTALNLKRSIAQQCDRLVNNAGGTSIIRRVEVMSVDFGSRQLRVIGITGGKPTSPPSQYRLDADVDWQSDAKIRLDVTLRLGVKVAVSVDDFDLRGKMRLDWEFKGRGGLVKMIAFSFRKMPQLGFRIGTQTLTDLMELPTIKDTVQKIVSESIRNMMLYPNSYKYDFTASAAPVPPLHVQSDSIISSSKSPNDAHAAPNSYSQPPSPRDGKSPGSTNSGGPSPRSEPVSPSSVTPTHVLAKPPQPQVYSVPTIHPAGKESATALHHTTSTSQLHPHPKHPQTALTRTNSTPATHHGPGAPPLHTAPVPVHAHSTMPPAAKPMKLKFGDVLATLEGKDIEKARKPRPKQKPPPKKYLDEDGQFIVVSPPELEGTLTLRVAEAVKLASGDFFSCDPYVVVELAGQVQKTEEASSDSPHWHKANFEFSVYRSKDPSAKVVMFKVFDHKLIEDDKPIGWVSYDITTCMKMPDQLFDTWLELQDTTSGRIHVQFTFSPD